MYDEEIWSAIRELLIFDERVQMKGLILNPLSRASFTL